MGNASLLRSDHVGRNALAARNNEAQGLGNILSSIVRKANTRDQNMVAFKRLEKSKIIKSSS